MKNLSQLSITLAAVMILGLAACSDKSTPDQAASSDAVTPATEMAAASSEAATPDSHAAQFLTDAMKGDNSEVKIAQLAADKGASQGVKDFGRMLVADHGKHKLQVAEVARSMGVPVTEDTKPEGDALYAKLQGLSGAEFDGEFVARMIENHKKGIAKNKEEAESSDPEPVKVLAAQTVPTLEKHLSTAQSLQ